MATVGMERIVIEVDTNLKRRIDIEAATKGISLRELLTPILMKKFPKENDDEKTTH